MQKHEAGGDEQCCATSVFVLHLLWGVDYTKCRANQNSCEESEITFHASNGAAQARAAFARRLERLVRLVSGVGVRQLVRRRRLSILVRYALA